MPLHACSLLPVTLKLNPKINQSNTRSSAFNRDNIIFALSATSSNFVEFLSVRRKAASTASASSTFTASSLRKTHHWMVVMEPPPEGVNSKPQIIDYFVKTLRTVLGSEKDAQMSIYHASTDTHFGFCCDIDEESSCELAGLPGVLAVRPDPNYGATEKDYSKSAVQLGSLLNPLIGSALFPAGNTKGWLVSMDKPTLGVVTKAQIVDCYTQVLSKVMGNEKDAQMCIYHVSWESNFEFCCELDQECAEELAGVPGVLSVRPDENFESANEDHGGENFPQFCNSPDPLAANGTTNIKTKKLFVTGLSFYTSEKTLRAAFEGFGKIVEVKIIMDKISKRSKGYGFVEYTTEAAAGAALKEMNGKIINGWMITVDVAKSKPPKYSRGRPGPAV